MAYIPGQLSKQKTTTSGTRYTPGMLGGSKKTTASTKTPAVDYNDVNVLKQLAESKGLEVKEKKPSLFMRTLDVISRPLYASAGAAKAVIKGENVLQEAWKGLKGQEKETYSDVLGELGVKNKYVKGIVGFALDVALDPSTYFGGTVVKGAGKVLGGAGKVALEAGRKVNPESIRALEAAGTSLKDAFGHAFSYMYKADDYLKQSVPTFLNKLGLAKEEVINKFDDAFKALPKAEHEDFARTLLEHRKQIKTLEEKFGDRALAKQQLNQMAPQFSTATQKEFFEKTYKPLVDEMADAAKIPLDERFTAYYPSISEDYLKAGKGQASGFGLSDKSYEKLYKGINKNEIAKPVEALSRQSFKILRDNMTKELMDDTVKTVGKPLTAFKNADDALKEGYVAIKEKGQFGKELGYIKQDDYKAMQGILYPEFKVIDNLAKVSGYDKFTKWFKTGVTSFFPSFHVRNFISGNIQNYERLGAEALNPRNHINGLGILKGSDNVLSFPKWQGTGKELKKILNDKFGYASRYISDIGDYVDEIGSNTFRMKKNIGKLDPRKVGNFVEMWQKSTATSAALKQGKTLPEALKLAEEAGFNYAKITPFEAKIMRRMIPFYTFTKKNLELQARTAAQNPERILNIKKAFNGLTEMFGGKPTDEDLKGLPQWAIDSLGIKLKEGKWVYGFDMPFEQTLETVTKPLKTITSGLNPFIKRPLEVTTGYNFFRQKPLKEVTNIDGGLVNTLPDVVKNWLEIKSYDFNGRTYYKANPTKLNLIENSPFTRLMSSIKSLKDIDKTDQEKLLAFIVGAKVENIDRQKQEFFENRDLKKQLEEMLIESGELAEFSRVYKPKEKNLIEIIGGSK